MVVGTGDYASAPTLYVAAKCQIPTLIQEQNAVLGLTNKILARYANIVCTAYTNMATPIPFKKTVLTGNPVRKSLMQLNRKREASYEFFDLASDKKCLLVLGGSLGARNINKSISKAIGTLSEAGLQIIWATGRMYFETIRAQLTKVQMDTVRIYPFIKAMDLAYAAADIVVSRAGALAVAELCTVQKPVIFVPSPNVTKDHQTKNILPLVKDEAALMVTDGEAEPYLAQTILSLLKLEHQQKILSKNIRHWARPNATAAIVQEVVHLASKSPYRPRRNQIVP